MACILFLCSFSKDALLLKHVFKTGSSPRPGSQLGLWWKEACTVLSCLLDMSVPSSLGSKDTTWLQRRAGA